MSTLQSAKSPAVDPLKKPKKNLDMTQGSPAKMLIRFAIPMFLGNLFQQLYNMVDSIIVGQFVGSSALAAVGTSMPVFMLLVSLFMGFGVGASILISQFFGAREYASMRRTANTTLTITLFAGIFLTVVGFITAPYLLRLMQVEDSYFDMALTYMRTIMGGITVMLYYNIISGILRGLGDARSPLYFLIISSILNVLLDLLFVVAFGWGVAGVAIATVIAQTTSVIFAIFRLGKVSEHLKVKLKDMRVDWKLAKEVVRLGLPSGMQQSVFSIAQMFMQGMINSFGVHITACFNATMRVDMLVMMPLMNLGMALTTFTGQNVGANNMNRVSQGVKAAFKMSALIGIVLSAGLFFFGKYIMMMFINEAEVLEPGIEMMKTLAFFYPLAGFTQIFAGTLRGAGEAKQPLINSLVATLAVRLPMAVLLINLWGTHNSIYWSMAIGWAFGLIHIMLYYRFGKWRNRCIERMERRKRENASVSQEIDVGETVQQS